MFTIRTIIAYPVKQKKKKQAPKYKARGEEERKYEDGVCVFPSCLRPRNPSFRYCDHCLERARKYKKPKGTTPAKDRTSHEYLSKHDKGYKAEHGFCNNRSCNNPVVVKDGRKLKTCQECLDRFAKARSNRKELHGGSVRLHGGEQPQGSDSGAPPCGGPTAVERIQDDARRAA